MEEEKEFKDIKLGASFAYKGVIYECRLGLTCDGCAFNIGDKHYGCCKPKFFGCCSCLQRVDNRDVIFVEIGKEKPAVPKTEFALNEEFQCGLKRLKCVRTKKKDDCFGCFFEETGCLFTVELIGNCCPSKRSDGNDVIFVEVEPKD